MAISDTWFKRDGTPSANHPSKNNNRNRWRIRYHGQSQSFPDQNRSKEPAPDDKPPRHVEVAWARMLTRERVVRRQADDQTVSELLDRWLATKEGLEPRGYRACKDAVAHVRRDWGDRDPQSIETEEVKVWVARMKAERTRKDGTIDSWPASASMRHKNLQALSGALALWDGLNPCIGVKAPKEKPRESDWLEPADIQKIVESCNGYEALIYTLVTTGVRIGEACALNVGDVDLRRGRVRVRKSKNGQPRDVAVPPKVLAMYDMDRPRSEPLFTTRQGRRVPKDNFRARYWNPAIKAAGLEGVWIHDMRHAAASLMIASGAVVKDVQAELGHSSGVMTLDRYTRRWDKGIDEVAKRMDDLLP